MSVATALPRARRGLLSFLATLTLSAVAAGALAAQGVTTGAVRGRVLDQQGQPITGATLQLVQRNTGGRFLGSTTASGNFFIPNVIVGPYVIEARAIGFRPAGRTDLVVTLGQVADVELRLEAATVELEAISVTGAGENDLLARSRTGATSFVSENIIENLPSVNRNVFDFAATNSMVNATGTSGNGVGVSIAGQNDRFNSLQIDGGTNSDLFALNSSRGSPGGGNGSRPLTIEAVQEYQVLIAPFDVRQGGFTGGLMNAVTKSGTNRLSGSAYIFTQDDAFTGKDTLGNRAGELDLQFYGFSVGGPIVRDRLHFFAAAEWRSRTSPFGGLSIGSDTTGGRDSIGVGIRRATADRVRDYAINTLGFDPGDPGRPQIPNPDRNLFFKLTGQIGSRSQIELSYNNVRSSELRLTRDPTGPNLTRIRDGYQFDASGYDNASQTDGFRARLNTPFSNRFTNELIVSYNKFKDEREMGTPLPLLIVGADRRANPTANPTTFLAMGGERFSHANLLEQNILEIANNLTVDLGRHVLTLGGRAERFNFLNVFFPGSLGNWFFPDTTAFFGTNNAGVPLPTRYELALPGSFLDPVNGRTDGPIADFTFSQFGLYGQDQWSPTSRLTLTIGARFDFTSLPKPSYNIFMDTITVRNGPGIGDSLGIRTDNTPTDALLISPRFGFNYDVRGNGSFLVRGGIGIFSGRTPYVWASNAYTNTGLEQVLLTCDGAATGPLTTDTVPTFTADPTAQPTACQGGAGAAAATPAIVFFDQNFKLPQNLRLAFGIDRSLPWNMVASFDALYTRALNQFLLEDVNLVEGGTSVGEGNRRLYGTLSGTSSTATPRRRTRVGTSDRVRDVLRQYNSNEDYSYSLTFALNKRFSDNLEFSAGYTFSRAYDLFSGTSDISNSNLNFASLDGTYRDRNLTPSYFDIPHSIRLSGTTMLPYGVRFSLFYTGRSGRPFAYRYGSDVNADGFNGNDLLYVPLNAQDISLNNPAQWATLNAFIESQDCLREQRGRIMARNSCRNPWQSFLDARFGKIFPTVRGQNLEVSLSVFNLLSFLGVGGQIRETTGFENQAALTLARYSSALGRGVYNLALPQVNRVSINASRWRMELGARYTF